MTTDTENTTFAFSDDELSLTVAALVQTAHYAKESRDNEAHSAYDKLHDQRIINEAHALLNKLIQATMDSQGPSAALGLMDTANELWHGLVGELPTTDEAEATA